MEQRATGFVLESKLRAGLAERLAREARAQYVMVRDYVGQLRDVPDRAHLPVVRIHQVAISVRVAGEDALVSQIGQGVMETTYPAEQVNEPH